ncbi:MAG: hypothetical protein ACO1TE_29375 [Prosthecobacter sp.]
MNPNAIEYSISGGSAEAISIPGGLFRAELIFLLLATLFGIALYWRRRQTCVLLLPLGTLLFAVDLLPWLLGSVPAVASSQAVSKAMLAISSLPWLRPVGALLLAIYALMQWRGAAKS